MKPIQSSPADALLSSANRSDTTAAASAPATAFESVLAAMLAGAKTTAPLPGKGVETQALEGENIAVDRAATASAEPAGDADASESAGQARRMDHAELRFKFFVESSSQGAAEQQFINAKLMSILSQGRVPANHTQGLEHVSASAAKLAQAAKGASVGGASSPAVQSGTPPVLPSGVVSSAARTSSDTESEPATPSRPDDTVVPLMMLAYAQAMTGMPPGDTARSATTPPTAANAALPQQHSEAASRAVALESRLVPMRPVTLPEPSAPEPPMPPSSDTPGSAIPYGGGPLVDNFGSTAIGTVDPQPINDPVVFGRGLDIRVELGSGNRGPAAPSILPRVMPAGPARAGVAAVGPAGTGRAAFAFGPAAAPLIGARLRASEHASVDPRGAAVERGTGATVNAQELGSGEKLGPSNPLMVARDAAENAASAGVPAPKADASVGSPVAVSQTGNAAGSSDSGGERPNTGSGGRHGSERAEPVTMRSESAEVSPAPTLDAGSPAARLSPRLVDSPAEASSQQATPLDHPDAPAPTDRVTVRLSDEDGASRIQISVRGDVVHARIMGGDDAMAQRLETGLSELREGLTRQGFQETHVRVDSAPATQAGWQTAAAADSAGAGDARQQDNQERHQRQERERPGADPRSDRREEQQQGRSHQRARRERER